MPYLHEVFREAAERYGSRPAFDDLRGRLSFTQAQGRAEALAGSLEHLGLRSGDRVAILAENCIDYMMYHYATAMMGAMLLPLNTRHTNAERLWILNNAEAGTLVTDEAHESHLVELKEGCPSVRVTIGIGAVEAAEASTDDLAGEARDLRDPPPMAETDPVLLIYTSGTTGRPKGAFQNHQGSTMIDGLTADALDLTSDDVYFAVMPYFHQAGLIRSRATFLRGGLNLVPGKVDLGNLASVIDEKDVSVTMLVPPMDALLIDEAERKGLKLESLRMIIGGGGMAQEHAKRMQSFCRLFDCSYVGVYGQTEATGPVTVVRDDEYFLNPYTCGRPMPGIDIRIWDDRKRALDSGEVGEIMIRGLNTSPGYWRNDRANAELYTGPWLHTGDLGRLDENGFLYIAGRKKELIKTGGENVYPREVEEVLTNHEAVADVTVIGLPDPGGWGEKVTAVIVPRENMEVSLEDVRSFCREKVAGYKIPKEIFLVKAIPRNATGKVKKVELKEEILQRKSG